MYVRKPARAADGLPRNMFFFSSKNMFFSYGGYLVKIGIIKEPGDLFAVVFSMLIGSYFLGVVSPHLMVLLNARVAAATIYETIDRVGFTKLIKLVKKSCSERSGGK